MIHKALVENPYFGRDYDGQYGWSNSASQLFCSNNSEHIELDVVLDGNEQWQPYFNQTVMQDAFFGCRLVRLLQ